MNKNVLTETLPIKSVGSETGFNIDYKRVLYHVFKYWYLVVLSLLLAIAIAFIKNRYSTRVIPISASIIIKESEESSEGKFVFNNPLVNFYRNYLNELYIVKSYPLIQKTIQDLNFQVGFYKEGSVLTTETYYNMPIRARVVDEDPSARGFSVIFQALNEREYRISPPKGGAIPFAGTYSYGDTLSAGTNKFVLERIDSFGGGYINEDFIFRYTPSSILASVYISRLNASWAEEGAGVINLSISGSIPQKEIDFLNALIDQYANYNLTKKSLAATRSIEFISEQLEGITDSLKRVERQLEQFKNRNVVTDLKSEALRLYQKIEGLESQKTELILHENYYNYLREHMEEGKNLDQIILPSSVGITDNILTGLVSKMIDLQMEMKMHISGEKRDHPLITQNRNRIQQIKRDIVESINGQRSVEKIRLNFLNREIATIEKQLDYLPVAERQLIAINRNYNLLDNLFVFLMQKKAEAGISRASTTSDVIVVNPPLAGGFVSPKIRLNYLLAISLGLALPLMVFVGLELSNTKVQSREDIEEQTNVPILGGTGHKKSEGNLEVMGKPKSAVAESFRALRSNLFYFMANKERGTFLVTSSISGEGKTFTSINLASVFALSGKRTLIIGADMRRPKIFEDFNLTNDVGLSSYLAGLVEFDAIIQSTSFPNLFLVSGGPVPPNPSELLLSHRMELFMNQARDKFDMVVIDSPPLALVADAFELARFADHTIFLVRQDYTPKVLLRTIQDFHQSGKLANVSIVLNDIYRSGLGYGYGYGYTYGYGYGYYNSKKRTGGYYTD
jgi:capsular exopolysaccharide synthesis family protein